MATAARRIRIISGTFHTGEGSSWPGLHALIGERRARPVSGTTPSRPTNCGHRQYSSAACAPPPRASPAGGRPQATGPRPERADPIREQVLDRRAALPVHPATGDLARPRRRSGLGRRNTGALGRCCGRDPPERRIRLRPGDAGREGPWRHWPRSRRPPPTARVACDNSGQDRRSASRRAVDRRGTGPGSAEVSGTASQVTAACVVPGK